jgi:DNA-binding MarR family transcriptional regulator
MMQTSTIYDRLRREEKEEAKRVYLSALAFLQMLPKQFTTAEAVRLGEELGLKQNGIAKKISRLVKERYIVKVRQGVFVKSSKIERERWKRECTLLAA